MRAVSPERAIELFNSFGESSDAFVIELDEDAVLVDGYIDYSGRTFTNEVCTVQWLVYEVYRLQRQQRCFEQKGVKDA